jgi:hypothetical protein
MAAAVDFRHRPPPATLAQLDTADNPPVVDSLRTGKNLWQQRLYDGPLLVA